MLLRPARSTIPLLLLPLLLAVAPTWAMAQARVVVQLASDIGEWVAVDYHAEKLLEGGAGEALKAGLPTRVSVRVELWQNRRLWDRLVDSYRFGYRVVFDVLEEQYHVYDELGEWVASTARLGELEHIVARDEDAEVVPMDQLKPGKRYFVVTEIEVQPMSALEVKDLEEWIRGHGRFSGVSRNLLGLLKHQVGPKETRVTGRTAKFSLEELLQR